MENRYIPRPCVADVSSNGIARARDTFSGGVLVYDAADPRQVLAVIKADERGFYDHAERVRLALQPQEGEPLEFLLALARHVHAQANGLTAWSKLTDAGRHLYAERMRQALHDARQDRPHPPLESGAAAPIIVAVHINGGMVEEIETDRHHPGLKVVVIDKDTDDAEPDDLLEVQEVCQGSTSMSWSLAHVSVHEPHHNELRDFMDDFRDPNTEKPVNIFEEMDAGSAAVFCRLAEFLAPGYDLMKVPQDRLWDAWRPSAAVAEGEGWGIFDSGNYGLEIEADAESTIFVRGGEAFDDEAVEFVRTKATAGSFYHSVAIAIHDLGAVERKAKCEAAGYKASCGVDGDTVVWSVLTPEGKIAVVAAQTEEAAWAYAYRHLGEQGEG